MQLVSFIMSALVHGKTVRGQYSMQAVKLNIQEKQNDSSYLYDWLSHDYAMPSVWILAAESRWYLMESQHFNLEHWLTFLQV